MEATENCTKAISTTQEAGLEANSIIDAMYEGCARYLVMPHVRHVCMLQPLVRPHVMHARLGLHIAVSLKGKTTRI